MFSAFPSKTSIRDQEHRYHCRKTGLNSFISGAADNGLAGGLVAVAISSLDSSAKVFRTEVDEWNAIVDPSGYATIYEAESDVLKNVTERTTKSLRKQG